jgi:hypothetical protein
MWEVVLGQRTFYDIVIDGETNRRMRLGNLNARYIGLWPIQ